MSRYFEAIKQIGIIYIATNKITKKSYIGQTTQCLKHRINGHYKNKADTHFSRALKKYKKQDWQWEILYDNVLKSQLNAMERFGIAKYNTFNNGYNSTLGGDANPMDNPQTRIKMLKNRNFKHTDESRGKISLALKGRKRSKSHSDNLSLSLKGRKFSKKHLQNLKKSQPDKYGENNPMFGKNHSNDTKKNIRNKLAKNWEITYPNGAVEIIKGLKQFCKENNLCRVNMARGRYKGFKCERIY